MAHGIASGMSGLTTAPTGLVHDIVPALQRMNSPLTDGEFLAIARTALVRRIRERARRRNQLKRGGGVKPLPFDDQLVDVDERVADCNGDRSQDLADALEWLSSDYPEQCEVLCRRLFQQATDAEIANMQRVSSSAVRRRFDSALQLLREKLEHGDTTIKD